MNRLTIPRTSSIHNIGKPEYIETTPNAVAVYILSRLQFRIQHNVAVWKFLYLALITPRYGFRRNATKVVPRLSKVVGINHTATPNTNI